jgi:hypothetical protein
MVNSHLRADMVCCRSVALNAVVKQQVYHICATSEDE